MNRGLSLRRVVGAVLLAVAVVLFAAELVALAWGGALPGLYVLAMFPLLLGAASLLSSDVMLTDEERLDRHLGLSFRGDARAVAQAAYAELSIAPEDV